MIYLKIFLALLLAILPFVYANYLRNAKKEGAQKSTLYTFIFNHASKIIWAWTKVKNFFHRLYEGMKRSDSFRRFFTLVLLLILIAYQFVDFHVAANVAHMALPYVEKSADKNVEHIAEISAYLPYLTRPHATILAATFAMLFFLHRLGNIILNRLHESRRIFFLTALGCLCILLMAPRFFILAETIDIVLMAAYIYPKKRHQIPPKGGMPIP